MISLQCGKLKRRWTSCDIPKGTFSCHSIKSMHFSVRPSNAMLYLLEAMLQDFHSWHGNGGSYLKFAHDGSGRRHSISWNEDFLFTAIHTDTRVRRSCTKLGCLHKGLKSYRTMPLCSYGFASHCASYWCAWFKCLSSWQKYCTEIKRRRKCQYFIHSHIQTASSTA